MVRKKEGKDWQKYLEQFPTAPESADTENEQEEIDPEVSQYLDQFPDEEEVDDLTGEGEDWETYVAKFEDEPEDEGFFEEAGETATDLGEGFIRGVKTELIPFDLSEEDKRELREDSGWSGLTGELVGSITTGIAAAAAAGKAGAAIGGALAGPAAPLGALIGAGVGTLGYAIYSGLGQENVATIVTGEEPSAWRAAGRVALTVNPVARISGKASKMIQTGMRSKAGKVLSEAADFSEKQGVRIARAAAQIGGEYTISRDLHGEAGGVIGAGISLVMSPIMFRRMHAPPTPKVTENVNEFFKSPVGHDFQRKVAERVEKEIPEDIKLTTRKLKNSKFQRYVLSRPEGGQKWDEIENLTPQQLGKKFKKLRAGKDKQGKPTGGLTEGQLLDLWKGYITRNIAIDEMKKINRSLGGKWGKEALNMEGSKKEVEETIAGMDPISKIEQLMLDGQYAARQNDRVFGDNMAQVLNDISEQGASYMGHQMSLLNRGLGVVNLTKKSGLNLKQIGRLRVYVSEKDNTALTDDLRKYVTDDFKIKDPNIKKVMNAWDNLFNTARETVQSYGYQIGHIPHYVPMKSKDRVAMALRLEKAGSTLKGYANAANYSDFTNLTEEGLRRVGLEGVELERAKRLVDNINRLVKRRLKIEPEEATEQDVKRLISSMINPEDARTMGTDISALYSREGLPIADEFREYDLGALFLSYVQGNVKSAVMNPALRKLADKVDIYRAGGSKIMADWTNNLLLDLSVGKSADRFRVHDMVTAAFDNFRYRAAKYMDKIGLEEDSSIRVFADQMPDFVAKWQAGLYPAYLGANVRAITRNLQQNLLITAPELGGAYGYTAVAKGLVRSIKEAKKGKGKLYQNMKEAMQRRNLGSEGGMRAEMFKDVSINLGKLGSSAKFINDTLMAFYSGTDVINRSIAYHTAQQIADDLIKGKPAALKAMKNMGQATKSLLRAKGVEEIIDRGDKDELGDILGRIMVSKTQFHYGKEQRAEFLRFMGPFFSMFSKWPAAVGSNIYDIWKENPNAAKRFMRYTNVYMAPYAALYGMTYMMEEGFGEEGLHKYLIGDLTEGSPIESLKVFVGQESLIEPPVLDFASQLFDPTDMADDPAKSLKKKAKLILKTSAPPVSSFLNELERFDRATKRGRKTTVDEMLGD